MRSDLCSIITVGGLRSIQHAIEQGPYKNPDYLARYFVDDVLRSEASAAEWWTKKDKLAKHPFYNYLALRTRYYDDVFVGAVHSGARQIVLLGSGTDTRAYRFRELLLERDVRVFECDQPTAIAEKARDARKLGDCAHVVFSALDLHSTSPGEWVRTSGYEVNARTLILAEGVTPYVLQDAFQLWSEFFARCCAPGTLLACDYKLAGCDDAFGAIADTRTIRVPAEPASLIALHRTWGWRAVEVNDARQLLHRYHAEGLREPRPLFAEDVIVLATNVMA